MVHVYLTIFVMALTTAFRDWMDQQDKLEKKARIPASGSSGKRLNRKMETN